MKKSKSEPDTSPYSSHKRYITRRLVTPAEAGEMLAWNLLNRRMKEQSVRDMVACLKAGGLTDTAETIKFDIAGILMDGQNRLEAIRRSGVGADCDIAFGLPPEARQYIDMGEARTTGDYVRINQLGISETAMSVAKMISEVLEPQGRHSKAQRNQIAYKYAKQYEEGINFVLEHLLNRLPVPVLLACVAAYYNGYAETVVKIGALLKRERFKPVEVSQYLNNQVRLLQIPLDGDEKRIYYGARGKLHLYHLFLKGIDAVVAKHKVKPRLSSQEAARDLPFALPRNPKSQLQAQERKAS